MSVVCKNKTVQPDTQRGLALLVFVILIALVSITVYVNSMSVASLKNERNKTSVKALSEAKDALLAYAVINVDYKPGEYGFLPCPDLFDNAAPEGGSDSTCNGANKNTIGLLPWRSLETRLMRSESGGCLWYAVSGDYKSDPKTGMLNEDTNGLFRLYDANENLVAGSQPEDRIVAMIFDPSRPVASQSRSFDDSSQCGLDYDATQFLEGNGSLDNGVLSGVADTIDDFILADATSETWAVPFNDRIEVITRRELWDAVTRRGDFIANAGSKMRNLTQAMAMCVAAYGNKAGNRRLPRPAAVDFGADDYRVDDDYDDTPAVSYLGRYPHTVDDSDTELGANVPPGGSVLFDRGFCNAFAVGGGDVANLETGSGSEYYRLWKNWKDHFFYAVSAYYAPTSAADTGAPACTGGNCVTVNGVEYAAVVIYSNSRTGVQTRNAPIAGDTDTKNTLANYIEVTNPAGTGAGDYTPTANDIVYCITDNDPLTVVSCP